MTDSWIAAHPAADPRPRRVAVVGAGGKTGAAVAGALNEAGATVCRVGRREFDDLEGTLTGCAAVYLIAPNMHPDEPGFVATVLEAAAAARVGHVVYHSVASPYAPDMPHHTRKADAEDLVRRGSCSWTILQPCAYMQNLLPAVAAPDPVLRVPYDTTRPFGLVDLGDVGEAAATVLLNRAFHGSTVELGGPGLVSVCDVATIAHHALGKDVRVERISTEEWAQTDGSGLEPRVRDWLVAMFDYYDAHGLPAGPVALQALLGRPATPVADVLLRSC